MREHGVLKRSLAGSHAAGGLGAHPHAGEARLDGRQRRARKNFPGLSQFAVEHLLLLPLGALVALVWANLYAESYFRFTYGIAFLVNEVAMAFFFGLMTKEVVEATAAAGVLHPWRRAALPLVVAPAAVIVPALIFVAAVRAFDEPLLARAWLVLGAVDVAFAYFVARLVFRPRHPAIPLLILLAIAIDALALVMLAILHPAYDPHPVLGTLVLMVALASAGLLRRSRVKIFWPYLLFSGALSWCGMYLLGVHPALALVPILPFMPHAARDPGFFVDAPRQMKDALSQFEHVFNYPVQIALFFFALVNAGVIFRAVEPGVWSFPIAAVLGKPLGLALGIGLAIALGLRLPHDLGWREMLVVGLVVSAGFTFALYLANGVLAPGQLLAETRTGVLMCVLFMPVAILAARMLRVGRFAR